MPFTDTGALGGDRGAASLPGSRRSGGSTNVKGSRNGSAPSARASIGSVRAAAANPDFDFRYDASLPGYIYNLSTKGLATGTWALNFTIPGDPTSHSVQFDVR